MGLDLSGHNEFYKLFDVYTKVGSCFMFIKLNTYLSQLPVRLPRHLTDKIVL